MTYQARFLKWVRAGCCLLWAGALGAVMLRAEPVKLAPAVLPVDNPLKGLVPYAGPAAVNFPHSLEFQYLPLNILMTGPDTFEWQPLERLLEEVAAHGNQTVFRVWVEFPGRRSGVPQFLLDAGVKITKWNSGDESRPRTCFTPDYEDERLVSALERFVAALGQRYDGDSRIGFITAGLLGSWGEWHTWPRPDLFASPRTQRRVMDALQQAFIKTHILLRYPVGKDDDKNAANAHRAMGYHDDSFGWDTLETSRGSFVASLKAAGEAAVTKWQTQPIGGEIRPEIWGQVFDENPQDTNAQNFAECVRQTHVTWLMDSGIFEAHQPAARYQRAIERVRRMGYDFFVQTAEISRNGSKMALRLSVTNQGAAPFYYDWKMELAAIANDGGIAQRWPVDWKLTGLLPGDPARVWEAVIDVGELARQPCTLAVRAINPLSGGKPLKFANADQDRNAKGWLSLGRLSDVSVRTAPSKRP